MGAQDNVATAQAFIEAFNANDPDAGIALCVAEVEVTNVATGEVFRAADGIRRFFQYWMTAFPDVEAYTKAAIADKDGAVIEFRGRGTHTGPLESPDGTISPTGRTIDVACVLVNELRRAKITHSRLYFDFATLLRQLGKLGQVGVSPARI